MDTARVERALADPKAFLATAEREDAEHDGVGNGSAEDDTLSAPASLSA